ncbi:Piwi-like protein Siwi [Amphibalanus amphitrite]|uniref:Piwi-like protein Siwi n=1 Tax=Amphibalanus amphitrite TaxID=1232801 RepID=A0A6A4WR30_AMPAM|nr:Piwi-like protein Siwi [Amphibalanus amphitrite]
MEPPPTGRARGRARGRGRSQQQQQQPGADRRPGEPATVQAAQPTVGASAVPTGAAPPTRASHHPSAAREPTTADGLVRDMSALQVGSSVGGSTEAQASSGGNGAASVGRGATRGRRDGGPREARQMETTRPEKIVSKVGGIGAPIQLMVNYFNVVDKTSWSIKQYRVDFDPPEDNTRFRKKLLRAHQARLGQHYIFDGTMLFLERMLPEQELELLSVKESDGSKVRILIKFTHEVPPMDHQFINIFNIITNQCMSLIGYTKLRKQDREFFDMKQAQSADRGQLEIWPGYGAAVNQFEHNVLMCVSVSHKVLRMDSVLNQLSSIQRQFPRDARAAAERRLLGCIVMCRHNLRMYKIDEIMWDKTPAAEFDYKGTKIPLAKYYQEKHNITVSMDQPLLLSNPKRREMRQGQTEPFWLVPELCNMTGLSDEMRNNNNLMKELSGFLNMPPQQRAQKLHQFSTRLNSSEDVKSLLSFWGLKFSRELLKEQAAKCLTSVKNVARNFGMMIDEPRKILVSEDRVQGYVQAIEQNFSPEAQLVMCIIPSKDKTKYDAIKQLLCLRRPVPSQVVTARLIQTNKNTLGVATKIALQMNCKLGGVPWEVKIPMSGSMIVGYDTYHESQHKGASAGAWVASMNANASKYYSLATIHKDKEEICSHMQSNMMLSMCRYREINGSFPTNVIVYRDGIGEGSLRYVHQHEIDRIKAAITELNAPTRLCFIIVTKNINTRVFAQGRGGGVDNPPPGTVVDDVITRPERYDFYLISQKTRIGTVTPTMYNVILDETSYMPKHLQMLSYKLAHMYFNLSSTVRVPAPSHYAHRLAFLVGQSLHQQHHLDLANELFFL